MKFIAVVVLSILWGFPSHAQLDLHAHLDMKPGTGLLLQGAFNEEPQANEWGSRYKTKATQKSFISATPLSPLIVISLYGHAQLAFTEVSDVSLFDPKTIVAKALEIEYQELVDWVKAHSDRFGFARNSIEAQKLIDAKKTALVLSIEGAYGALDTEEGFRKWIDDRGVAIVTPFHLTEDHFSGVALLAGFRAINSPYEFFKSLLITGFSCIKTYCKGTIGIKPEGSVLIERLIRRSVWIDTSHSSEMDLAELLPTLANANWPLLATHTQIREFYQAERGLGEAESAYIKEHDGILGLIPTSDMIDRWPTDQDRPSRDCKSGLDTFKETVSYAAKKYGAEKVTLGSDINAPLSGLSPSCTPDAKLGADLRKDSITRRGFYTYSQWPELAKHVTPDGNSSEEWNQKTLTHFLKLWARVRH